jgi:hypothetical protein
MNGHVFQVHSERPDPQQFGKTVEALGEYAAKNLKHFGDLVPFFKNLERPILDPVDDPTPAEEASKGKMRDWENRCDRLFKRDTAIDDNLKSLYSIAWGQCSEAMKAKLQSHDDFTSMDHKADSVWLLKEIRAITYQFEAQRYIFLALDDAHSDLRAYLQKPDETLSKYLHTFKTKIDVLEHYGGSFGTDKALVAAAKKIPGAPSDPTDLLKFTKNRALAVAFLKRADPARYGLLWSDLENQFSRGTDQYPDSLTAAYNLLLSYKKPTTATHNKKGAHHHQAAVGAPSVASAPATSSSSTSGQQELGMTFVQATTVPGQSSRAIPNDRETV